MCDVYKNVDECNIDKERKILIAFDNMIADIIKKKKKKTKFNSKGIVF